MELAGLEPAASWVRFGRPLRANSANLQGIERATVRHRPFLITYICRRFTGVKAREPALWPKRASHLDAVVDLLVANQRSARPRKSPLRPLPFAHCSTRYPAVSSAAGRRNEKRGSGVAVSRRKGARATCASVLVRAEQARHE